VRGRTGGVEIHHDITNVWSRRVPEQLGFHHVGQTKLSRALAPAETGLEFVWRISREQWLARDADRQVNGTVGQPE